MSPTFRRCVWLCLMAAISSAFAGEPERWVAPPAPRIVDSEAIVPVVEVFDDARYILHMPKPEQTDWRQTRYEVEISRSDDHPFSATLSVRPFVKDDEVAFFTIPRGSAGKYRLEIVDRSVYPFRRVWSGTLDSIHVMGR